MIILNLLLNSERKRSSSIGQSLGHLAMVKWLKKYLKTIELHIIVDSWSLNITGRCIRPVAEEVKKT